MSDVVNFGSPWMPPNAPIQISSNGSKRDFVQIDSILYPLFLYRIFTLSNWYFKESVLLNSYTPSSFLVVFTPSALIICISGNNVNLVQMRWKVKNSYSGFYGTEVLGVFLCVLIGANILDNSPLLKRCNVAK